MTIIIVDDDSEDQEIFIEALHAVDESIQCFAVSNCQQLLDMSTSPNFVFLDAHLPGMDSKECVRTIRERNILKNIPIIIYTGFISERDESEYQSLGIAHILKKPSNFDNLVQSLFSIIKK